MLHAYTARFDVTENLEKLFGLQGKLNKALVQFQGFATTNDGDWSICPDQLSESEPVHLSESPLQSQST